MIKTKVKDIFASDTNVIIHQANCFNMFGGGIARRIAQLFPEAEAVDSATKRGDRKKLGNFTVAAINRPEYPNLKYIFNVYGQYDTSSQVRATQYDALTVGLERVRDYLEANNLTSLSVGVPYKIGSGLGGGDWRIVSAILESVFDGSPVKLTIYQHPDFK